MAECMLMQGGGGIKSDDVTAVASDVRAGKTYLGADSDDDIKTGTLALKRMLVGTWDRQWNNSAQDKADYVQYFNCTSVPDYKNKTANDFSVEFTFCVVTGHSGSVEYTPTKTYDASTGRLGVSALLSRSTDGGWNGMSQSKGNVYAYYI